MKKLLAFSLLALLGFAPHVLAQGFTALAPIPGLTDTSATSVINSASLATFFNNLYKYLIGLAATLAVIEIIWAGLDIAIWHKDAVSAITDDKGRIYNALFGLVLVLSPVLVFSIINPSILNLSLDLPPIKLDATVQTTNLAGTNSGSPVIDSVSGCSVTGTSGVLQVATCPSSSAAQAWGQACSGTLSSGPTTKLADGTITSSVLFCAGTQKYVFIDLNSSTIVLSVISSIQPLAISSANPDNGSLAIKFANTCANLGRNTCISDLPRSTMSIPCDPLPKTQMASGASGKCYNETLSCEESGVVTMASSKCSRNPNWSPFQ